MNKYFYALILKGLFVCTFLSKIEGTESLESSPQVIQNNFLPVLKDNQVKFYIQDLLLHYWKISGLQEELILKILNMLEEYDQDSELAIKMVQQAYPELIDKTSLFYQNYSLARKARLKQYAERLIPAIKGEIVADVGSGDAQLVECLINLKPSIKKAYATDILPINQDSNDTISLVCQPSATDTGLALESVDTILLSGVLHHITPKERLKLLLHLTDVLKNEGRLILIEDTFPESLKIDDKYNELTKAFMQLERHQKEAVLAFIDWWGNRFLKNNPHIPLPCTYRTIEEWSLIIKETGLHLKKIDFLGLPDIHAHVMVPKAIFIFEKTELE